VPTGERVKVGARDGSSPRSLRRNSTADQIFILPTDSEGRNASHLDDLMLN
jgi:hypothetical protein